VPGPGVKNGAILLIGPILLIGAGRMGGALLKGWIANGIGPVVAVEPKPSAELKSFAKKHRVTLLGDANDVPQGTFAACIVALKPQVLKEAAPRLRAIAESGALMISIAAGTTTRSLAGAGGAKARVVRSMPNTPGAIGRGITAIYATPKATAKDRALAERLLSALGQTVWVKKENLIDAATAVSGSGPAYVFLLAEAMAEAGVAEGLPRAVAAKLARQTVSGAGALLDAETAAPAELRRNVTSPGGTTQAALDVLMADNGLGRLMKRAVAAARKRARALGR
jgi:pyrroline-5-carboxylate reductase